MRHWENPDQFLIVEIPPPIVHEPFEYEGEKDRRISLEFTHELLAKQFHNRRVPVATRAAMHFHRLAGHYCDNALLADLHGTQVMIALLNKSSLTTALFGHRSWLQDSLYVSQPIVVIPGTSSQEYRVVCEWEKNHRTEKKA